VLRPRENFYAQALPLPEDIMLVVGVAETPLHLPREPAIQPLLPVGVEAISQLLMLTDSGRDKRAAPRGTMSGCEGQALVKEFQATTEG
jgi:hypothetical protein